MIRTIAIRRTLPATAEAIWPHLTEPELMNPWSRARIRLVSPGDGGSAVGVGAVREVLIAVPGRRPAKLVEAIEDSDPPHRYVYRVVDAPLFRAHRGTVTISGNEVSWNVDFELASDVLGFAAEKLISSQLGQSLDALAPRRHAFLSMEGKNRRPGDARYALFYGLKQGIVAHIEEDLPRALAEIYVRDYSSKCDYVRFRCDYLLMGGIFEESSTRLLELVPKKWVPWYLRMFGASFPELADRLRRRRFYDVRRARKLAFERGERIAAMLLVD